MKSLTLLGLFISLSAVCDAQTIHLRDRSDWWSMNNEKYPGITVKLVEKHFDINNFRILGMSLDTLGFDLVASKLGKTKIVERGDASYSRSQACYVSVDDSEKVHLIFEGGEGGSSTFYLFRGGPDWKGSELCVRSNQISANLETGAGLKLGLSRVRVEAILGKPDFVAGDRIAYCREFQRKTTKEAHQESDSVPVTIQIEARFKNAEMNYLYVSTTSESDE